MTEITNWNEMAVNRARKAHLEPRIPHVSKFLRDGQWKDSPCVVLGGGPSMLPILGRLDEFPSETHFVGANQSWRLKAEVIYAIDVQVFDLAAIKFEEEWNRKAEEGQIRITHKVNAGKGDWSGCCWIDQVQNDQWGSSFEKGVISANNSGLIALNIADLLGANPIILLGFDSWKAGAPQNWHDDYPQEAGFRPKNPRVTCERWEFNLRTVAPKIQAKVLNASMESRYNAFRKIEFDKAIEVCRNAVERVSA